MKLNSISFANWSIKLSKHYSLLYWSAKVFCTRNKKVILTESTQEYGQITRSFVISFPGFFLPIELIYGRRLCVMQNIYFGKISILPTMLATRLMWKHHYMSEESTVQYLEDQKRVLKCNIWLLKYLRCNGLIV